MYPRVLNDLIQALSRLPGTGAKSAERLALHLLHLPSAQVKHLAALIERLKDSVYVCEICGTLSETPRCAICRDPERDKTLVAVVETPADIAALEGSMEYNGLYHVLAGSLSPLEGLGPKQLRVEALERRLQEGVIQEVLVATNPTVEGEATADFLLKSLSRYPVKITRLAYGMPVGGSLQYLDGLTLSRAFAGRTSLQNKE